MTDRPDRLPEGPIAAGCDPLSDVLRTVKLTGALFFLVDASSPWGVQIPQARHFAPVILPGAQGIVSYHVVTRGSGWANVQGEEPVPFEAGDVLVFPHGDAYAMLSAPGQAPELDHHSALAFFRGLMAGELPFVVREGGGGPERAAFVCGFLGCDLRPFNPLLAQLPHLLQVRPCAGAGGDLLDRLVALTLAEAPARDAGAECVRLRLSELMFIEVLRRHLHSLPVQQTGWLAGLRDPGVGRALALLHARPGDDWSLESLARDSALSRSVLAERFTHLVGCPPMQYLAQWRIQLASRRLADSSAKIAAVAGDVGYASEAAFSRSFKKMTGVSPSQWRRRSAPS
jgi:AraC-like DNA-binding protein